MGNILSSNDNANTEQQRQIKILTDRINQLESFDKNNDGIVSQDEFLKWQMEQEDQLNQFKLVIMKQKDQEYEERMSDLKREIKSLKTINASLERQLQEQTEDFKKELQHMKATPKKSLKLDQTLFSKLSKQRIQEAVDHMIQNSDINVGYLPDVVERQLYKNVFHILLGLLAEVVEGSNIQLLGHEITLDMKAKADKEGDEPDKSDESDKEDDYKDAEE